ncbi:uncharacterized protein LOC143607808 [Bidens hawaiensis]|uniref:uncharacterized protein LOC143607808 n=1 Tax=Bidens hawaiensis TaxID=980011 RepID=UPI0040496441
MAKAQTSDPEERSPSFFKVIRDPSSPLVFIHSLTLFPLLINKYMPMCMMSFVRSHCLKLFVSVTGKHSWRVEFEKIGEEYCFGNGWEKLVQDVGLCVRDVVIFWMIDAFKFCVSFLGVNGCEKDLPLYKIDDGVRECHDDDDDDDEVMTGENLCYKKVFRRSFRYYMRLPAKFVKAAGLEHP